MKIVKLKNTTLYNSLQTILIIVYINKSLLDKIMKLTIR